MWYRLRPMLEVLLRTLRLGFGAAFMVGFTASLVTLIVPLRSMEIFDRMLTTGHIELVFLATIGVGLMLAALDVLDAVQANRRIRDCASRSSLLWRRRFGMRRSEVRQSVSTNTWNTSTTKR